MKDQYGRKLNTGDCITYPVRQSSSMWMTTGIIDKVREDHIIVWTPVLEDGEVVSRRRTNLSRTDRVTKVAYTVLPVKARRILIGGN